ncbi:hypothetical protein QLX52_27595 [Streptomyces albus]|uniref:hypothetical protein n=1 Tax=Streptomyces albus TaxID=1888 RepID=UPI0024AD517C|nr:hypothetical protein [Streptomyces albus]MDI6412572.1 hypothetical protein [Streptomyces albus]
MDTTRRTLLGAAMASPLLAQFSGTAAAASVDDTWGTVSDAWVEIRWTAPAQAQLDRLEAVVEAVPPARLIKGAEGAALRFPVRTGRGEPSLNDLSKARGEGGLDGGLTVRTPQGTFRVTRLRGTLRDEVASGTCVVNGVEAGHRSLFRCGVAEGRLTAGQVPAGRPLKVRVGDMPLHPTPGLVEAFSATFGKPVFSTGTVLAHLSAEGVYTPPKR